MPTLALSTATRVKRFFVPPPPPKHRGTLRDLYTFGLVSVFRQHSIARVWEPLRENPAARRTDEPTN